MVNLRRYHRTTEGVDAEEVKGKIAIGASCVLLDADACEGIVGIHYRNWLSHELHLCPIEW